MRGFRANTDTAKLVFSSMAEGEGHNCEESTQGHTRMSQSIRNTVSSHLLGARHCSGYFTNSCNTNSLNLPSVLEGCRTHCREGNTKLPRGMSPAHGHTGPGIWIQACGSRVWAFSLELYWISLIICQPVMVTPFTENLVCM